MSLPPALLQRLAQRGLVQKKKRKKSENAAPAATTESEEVIAEDYDEMETEGQHGPEEYPSQYDYVDNSRKRTEDSFWAECMRARMGNAASSMGHKGCPNKYNIWHKCTLYCVNRWGDGRTEPSRDYMRRYRRLIRKYPLPKGWIEIYDPGCGVYYFCNTADNMVSWLPPTHPKSSITKTAAFFRRQMEDNNGELGAGSDGEQESDDENDLRAAQHQREIDEIIKLSMRGRISPKAAPPQHEFPTLQEAVATQATNSIGERADAVSQRKPKSRDLNRALSRQQRHGERNRRDEPRSHRYARDSTRDAVDPMDPSAYSDTPRGKWSDGLQPGGTDERRKANDAEGSAGKERATGGRQRKHAKRSDDSEDDD